MANMQGNEMKTTLETRRGQKVFRAARELETDLLRTIEEAEQRARQCGRYITMRALNRAKNALGYELAGDPVKAENAALPLLRKRRLSREISGKSNNKGAGI